MNGRLLRARPRNGKASERIDFFFSWARWLREWRHAGSYCDRGFCACKCFNADLWREPLLEIHTLQ